ncbi:MAG: DNA-binding protein HU-beta [Candidatus Poribacteria bacterium]|jgi:DNA-binding protein HU-beta|nr:DNA-binding protein HU-beta [Candidatus Poribacteria bacterium]
MVKADLIAKVAEIGITKKQAGEVVDAFVDAIKDALAKGDKVSLIGFGTFSVKERAAREGRNPRTGKKIKIAKKKVPTFKPGKELKDSVA